jgi:hypothetical protein
MMLQTRSTMSVTDSRQAGEGNSMMEMQEDSELHVPAATETPELKLTNTENEYSEALPHEASASANTDNMYADLGFWRPPMQEFDSNLLLKPTAATEVIPDVDSMIASIDKVQSHFMTSSCFKYKNLHIY